MASKGPVRSHERMNGVRLGAERLVPCLKQTDDPPASVVLLKWGLDFLIFKNNAVRYMLCDDDSVPHMCHPERPPQLLSP